MAAAGSAVWRPGHDRRTARDQRLGPQRHRFGTPRDLVIGVQLATADGRLAKAGGQVVKNVAGYDLSKLVSGSFGWLAAIVSATFKLSPMPRPRRRSLIDALDSARQLPRIADRDGLESARARRLRRARAVQRRQAMAASCLLRFASFADAVDAQMAALGAVSRLFTSSIRAHGRRGRA